MDERFRLPAASRKALARLGRERTIVRVDLARLVSKYLGETGKHLAELFDDAERKGWVLVFDEAEALFERRTEVDAAHDRYADRIIDYLIRRIEQHPGTVLAADADPDHATLTRFPTARHIPEP